MTVYCDEFSYRIAEANARPEESPNRKTAQQPPRKSIIGVRTLFAATTVLYFGLYSAFCGGEAFLLTGFGTDDPDMGTNRYSYDSRGHLASSLFYASNELGYTELIQIYTCDNQGNVLNSSLREVSYSPSNAFFPALTSYTISVSTNTFGPGRAVRRESFSTNFDDYYYHTNYSHSITVEVTTWTAKQQPLTYSYAADNNADGIFDSREDVTWTYGSGGRLLSELILADSNNDGVIDRIDRSFFETDRNGRLLSEWDETDEDADGTIDFRGATLFAYDQWGNEIKDVLSAYDENHNVIAQSTNFYSYERRSGIMGNSGGNRYTVKNKGSKRRMRIPLSPSCLAD